MDNIQQAVKECIRRELELLLPTACILNVIAKAVVCRSIMLWNSKWHLFLENKDPFQESFQHTRRKLLIARSNNPNNINTIKTLSISEKMI